MQSSIAQNSKAADLQKEIEQTSGEKKLELMLELVNIDKMPLDIDKLEQEAKKQNNMRYLAASYTLKANEFMNRYELDSISYYAESANAIYEKYDIDNPNQSYFCLAYVYFNRGYYNLVIYNISIYLKKNQNDPIAYQILGQLYNSSKNYSLAKENYLKAIDQLNKMEVENPRVSLLIYGGFAITLAYNKEYEAALENCAIMNDIWVKNLNKFPESMKEMYQFQVYNTYANTYIGMKDAEKAKLYLDKLKQIPKDKISEPFYYDMIKAMSEYYFLMKDYDTSLNYLEESLVFSEKENGDKTILIGFKEHKIEILEKQARYKDALSVQKELMQYKDSMYQENTSLQILELSKGYELEKVRVEQQKDKAELERSRAIIVGLIATIFLLCLILYLVKRNSKITKTKNEILYKQHTEVEKYINLTRERLVAKQKNKEPVDKESCLFDRIEKHMSEHEAYKNPDLTREDIAEALNTNWLYVIDAIKAETGKAFFDYVNEYRLNYTHIQLMEEELVPVGNIIQDSGFSSNSTFYRLFKHKFGMSPNELREIKAKIEHDIIKKGKS